jgi:hypothetical protein
MRVANIKILSYTGTHEALIKRVQIKTDIHGNTEITFVSSDDQAVLQLLQTKGLKPFPIKNLMFSPSSWGDSGIMLKTTLFSQDLLIAINALKEANYIAPDFANEICQNYPTNAGTCDITDEEAMSKRVHEIVEKMFSGFQRAGDSTIPAAENVSSGPTFGSIFSSLPKEHGTEEYYINNDLPCSTSFLKNSS